MLSNGFWSRLRRYPRAGYVGGVCAGLAAYYDVNVRILRAVLVIAVLCGWGLPIVAYLILWYLMESDPGLPDDSLPPGGVRSRSGDTTGTPATPPPNSTELRARFARMEERLRNMESCVSSNEYELRRELRKLEV
ncbi:MAG TPA: PspC domain-containing protein [Nevskiaceae bacterium]|nr:PspC domain-containing protein [Nevskiaceae bacterium]